MENEATYMYSIPLEIFHSSNSYNRTITHWIHTIAANKLWTWLKCTRNMLCRRYYIFITHVKPVMLITNLIFFVCVFLGMTSALLYPYPLFCLTDYNYPLHLFLYNSHFTIVSPSAINMFEKAEDGKYLLQV